MTDRSKSQIEEEIPDRTKEQLDQSAEEIGESAVQPLSDRIFEIIRELLWGGDN